MEVQVKSISGSHDQAPGAGGPARQGRVGTMDTAGTQDAQRDLAGVDEDALVAQLSRAALQEAAPEELDVFEQDAAGWLAGTHVPGRAEDDMVGFGMETAAVLLTPYVIAAAKAAVRYVAGILAESADAELRPTVTRWMQRLLGHHAAGKEAADTTDGLPLDVVARVKEETLRTCLDLGLDDTDAALVSDAVAGRLAVPAP